MKRLALLLTVCGLAHAQTVWTGTWSNGISDSIAGLRFETRTEPPTPVLPFLGSSSGRTVYRGQSGYSATHRYFRNDIDFTYVGYDVLVEQDAQPDTFRVTLMDLGIGPLDFAISPNGSARPTDWKKLQPPPLPGPRMVQLGDKVEVPVWIDPNTGQKLVDVFQVLKSAPALQNFSNMLRTSTMAPPRAAPVVPTVSGTAREFHVEDAEMHLVQPRVTLNGTPQGSPMRGGQGATGTLIWFYLPNRGRYILSLAPRPALGFVKSGEVRGGAIQFKIEGDEFLMESYTPIAPGSAPYILYVLHDGDWEPTARNQAGQFLSGSVSPAELEMLLKK